jgi:hypothetical protein
LLHMRTWVFDLHYKAFPFFYFGKLLAYPPNFF